MIFYYKFIALKVTALPYSRIDQIRSLFFVLYGMGVVVVSHPMFGLGDLLVFWFGLFYGCHWNGWRDFFPVQVRSSMLTGMG